MRWIFVFFLLLAACTPEAVKYARMRYPECDVDYLGSDGWHDSVRVKCPDESAKVMRYRKR